MKIDFYDNGVKFTPKKKRRTHNNWGSGTISNVRVWNRELSRDEINRILSYEPFEREYTGIWGDEI